MAGAGVAALRRVLLVARVAPSPSLPCVLGSLPFVQALVQAPIVYC